MKKFLLFLSLSCLFVFSTNAQQWVSFSSSEPKASELNLITSNAQTVTFSVSIPGIYTLDTLNSPTFTRLTLPGGVAVNPVGSPELPVLTYRVAIPNCDGVEVEYRIDSKISMIPCWVYPKPEMVVEQNPDGSKTLVEQFAFDPAAYAKPYLPKSAAIISSSGALRAQRYVEVMINTVEFCPVTKQLEVINNIEVTLTFTNPQGNLRQNVGIFNKVAAHTFINYEDDGMSAAINDKAFEKQGFSPGNVNWITLHNAADADTITADYLIITVPEFFTSNNPNSQLKRLAEHRAHYNGFDVAIVNVENVIADSVGFYYEGNPHTTDPTEPWEKYQKEQRMRTFIKRVYEGENAQHTGDGKLAYVLLVGDNYENANGNNEGMPTSWDWIDYYNPAPMPNPGKTDCASDYYFTCVTQDSVWGGYDPFGDLFIGRFSVEDSTQLYNMVQKTINHETEYSPKTWRRSAGFFMGLIASPIYHTTYLDWVSGVVQKKGWKCNTVSWWFDTGGTPYIKEPTLNCLNSGVAFALYFGHGTWYSWQSVFDIGEVRPGSTIPIKRLL
jgi:hypothetical protein